MPKDTSSAIHSKELQNDINTTLVEDSSSASIASNQDDPNEIITEQVGDSSERSYSLSQVIPDELYLQIFSNLDVGDIDSVCLVCKRWRHIANDAAYREVFKVIYGQSRFNRVTDSLSWRKELITRTEVLRHWRRGGGGNNAKPSMSFAPGVREIHFAQPDFNTNRSIVFNLADGIGTVVDHTRGKIAKPRLGTSQTLQLTRDVTVVDGSRFGMIYGFITGKVSAMVFSHDMRARTYISLDKFHDTPVTDVWISKDRSPFKNGDSLPSALSVGADGRVFVWDLSASKAIKEFRLPRKNKFDELANHRHDASTVYQPHEISTGGLKVLCTEKNTIVALDVDGQLFKMSLESEEPILFGAFPEFKNDRPFFIEVIGESIFVSQSRKLYRFDADSHYALEFNIPFLSRNANIEAMTIDRSSFAGWITSKGAPGDNWRYVAIGDSDSQVYIFGGVTTGAGASDARGNVAEAAPLLVIDLEHAPIHSLSMNSVVILVSSRFGATDMYDVLTGRYLGTACGEIHYTARRGLWTQGISQTIVDSNPLNSQGVIAVGAVLMYFDLGAKSSSSVKKKGVQQDPRRLAQARRRRQSNGYNGTEEDTEYTIKQQLQLMADDEARETEREVFEERLADYNNDELSEDEQLEYAMMLSKDEGSGNGTEEEDEELMKVIQASLAETSIDSSPSVTSTSTSVPAAELSEDEQLRLAIEASLAENSTPDAGQSSVHSVKSTGDPELDKVIQLSLQEH